MAHRLGTLVVALFVPVLASAQGVPPVATQAAGPVYFAGPAIASPVPVRQVQPVYTPAAMRAKIQGKVLLSGVVETDGHLDQLRVTRSLDSVYGLDENALAAASQWQFKPGQKDGQPVAVRVMVEINFVLHNRDGRPMAAASVPALYGASDAGVIAPKVKTSIAPIYAAEAMRAGISGAVTLDVEVRADGTVGNASVARSLDAAHGLDANAVAAVKQWTFEPGTYNGEPVPVLTAVTVQYRLH